MDRRRFIKNVAIGTGLGANVAAFMPDFNPDLYLRSPLSREGNRVIVFQGDSITDAGRNKQQQDANNTRGLGFGYAALATARLLAENPANGWICYNRGISGHKVFQLAERWEEDCLALQPDVLSILIGVNDFWHTLTHDYQGTSEIFERDLNALIERTKAALPDIKLIFGEPFAVSGGSAITDVWFPAFSEYQAAAKKIARSSNAVWIPYQQLFDDALADAPVEFWCPDGVHPALPGSYLMAQAWLDALHETLN